MKKKKKKKKTRRDLNSNYTARYVMYLHTTWPLLSLRRIFSFEIILELIIILKDIFYSNSYLKLQIYKYLQKF